MPLKPEAFQRQLAERDLPPVILLGGSEPLLVLEAADAVRARARESGYSERQVLDADSRFDWDKLAREGASMSLFASRRLIDLRLAGGRAGQQGSKALAQWVKAPPPDVLLLITADDWSKKHVVTWVKAIDKSGWFVPFWPVKPHEMTGWVQARLRTHGMQADQTAAQLLVDRTEGNLLAAAQEIDKLQMLGMSGRLEARTLSTLVANSARFDVFGLTDAAFAGDSKRALKMLRGMRSEGAEPLMMLGWLVRQLEQAMRLAQATDFNAQARKEGLWQARQQQFRSLLQRQNGPQLAACMAVAARIDAIAKGRAGGDVWRELDRLILGLADPTIAAKLPEPA